MMGTRIFNVFVELLFQYINLNITLSPQNGSDLDPFLSSRNFTENLYSLHNTEALFHLRGFTDQDTDRSVSSQNLSVELPDPLINWTVARPVTPEVLNLSRGGPSIKRNPVGDPPTLSTHPKPPLAMPDSLKKISASNRNCIIAYIVLFCVGAPGNLFVFISVGREMWRRQLIRSRIKVLIWHLATADLIVTFVVIPIEVFWRVTIEWQGGNALCKVAQFFRAFGLYVSSMIIICISLDRFFAIVFPLKVIGGMKRVRNMLSIAWIFSILFATPQFLVFRVQPHPEFTSFLLCSNSDYFLSQSKEVMYNLLCLIVMYFAPLVVIVVTYAMVLYKITQKSREHRLDSQPRCGSYQLRRSDNASIITRAKRKTLWLSMIIVTVFVICWTPYVSTTLWYMFDFDTADKLVDPQIHEAFFITAVSNSCVNPIIYGNYMKKYWDILRNTTCHTRSSSAGSNVIVSLPRGLDKNETPLNIRCKCRNPSHHRGSTLPCQSSTNASDVTVVLREFPL